MPTRKWCRPCARRRRPGRGSRSGLRRTAGSSPPKKSSCLIGDGFAAHPPLLSVISWSRKDRLLLVGTLYDVFAMARPVTSRIVPHLCHVACPNNLVHESCMRQTTAERQFYS